VDRLPERAVLRAIAGASVGAYLGRALPFEGLTLEIRLVLPAQHAIRLVHVASDTRSF
jgi:hypothetical protein